MHQKSSILTVTLWGNLIITAFLLFYSVKELLKVDENVINCETKIKYESRLELTYCLNEHTIAYSKHRNSSYLFKLHDLILANKETIEKDYYFVILNFNREVINRSGYYLRNGRFDESLKILELVFTDIKQVKTLQTRIKEYEQKYAEVEKLIRLGDLKESLRLLQDIANLEITLLRGESSLNFLRLVQLFNLARRDINLIEKSCNRESPQIACMRVLKNMQPKAISGNYIRIKFEIEKNRILREIINNLNNDSSFDEELILAIDSRLSNSFRRLNSSINIFNNGELSVFNNIISELENISRISGLNLEDYKKEYKDRYENKLAEVRNYNLALREYYKGNLKEAMEISKRISSQEGEILKERIRFDLKKQEETRQRELILELENKLSEGRMSREEYERFDKEVRDQKYRNQLEAWVRGYTQSAPKSLWGKAIELIESWSKVRGKDVWEERQAYYRLLLEFDQLVSQWPAAARFRDDLLNRISHQIYFYYGNFKENQSKINILEEMMRQFK